MVGGRGGHHAVDAQQVGPIKVDHQWYVLIGQQSHRPIAAPLLGQVGHGGGQSR